MTDPMDLKHYIRVYSKAFSDEICDKLIDLYEKTKDIPHDETLDFDDDHKKFNRINLNRKEPFVADISKIFVEYFDKYYYDTGLKYLPVSSEYEPVRIKKYPVGGYFKEHIDIWDRDSESRMLAGFVYLNESGGTKFFGELIPAEKGSLVIFPPHWLYPHEGVTGTEPKYFLGTYQLYPTPKEKEITGREKYEKDEKST